jgi:hypothetical protein
VATAAGAVAAAAKALLLVGTSLMSMFLLFVQLCGLFSAKVMTCKNDTLQATQNCFGMAL